MPKRNLDYYMKYALVLALPCVLSACSDLPTEKESRKKMPHLYMPQTEIPGLPGICNFAGDAASELFPFRTTAVNWSMDGGTNAFTLVAIPDASKDSIAFDMARTYRPVVTTLLQRWAATSGKGIMLDLRRSTETTQGAQYNVNAGGMNIPVVLLWDKSSAWRANAYKELLASVPDMQLVNDPNPAKYKTLHCFE
ncbi:hypothetical protein [Chitinophaga sp. sic0106]|uniref:hypothetical protein n=1 Tax=Chitinophaga sp. sic0106 TaxID=2854785 RepID=UPI001C462CED|nr:hypothetical protein [Chitinophaga sp. sic0106]MBV7531197.1 hypothetical protein [Chitinophaga sp. sic0106]